MKNKTETVMSIMALGCSLTIILALFILASGVSSYLSAQDNVLVLQIWAETDLYYNKIVSALINLAIGIFVMFDVTQLVYAVRKLRKLNSEGLAREE